MEQIKSALITQKYTKVLKEKNPTGTAPSKFEVRKADGTEDVLTQIVFQEGPILESGVNGVMGEDLIAMVIERLENFQKTPFACRENAMAITKLEESLMWLRKRTTARENRGVEGTHTV